jgi:4-aminobutyrate aminotransferase/(S)-3-amino-2-methylpropionate transaminase
MTAAKGLAGGFPLATVTGKAAIMDAPLPGGLGGTYAGSPIACAAALAVMDVIEEEGLVSRANEVGGRFVSRVRTLQTQYPRVIGEVRHVGAMIAMELVQDGDADQPDAGLTKELVQDAARRGLILLSCGVRGNVIRFLPALTISEELIEEGMDIVAKCLSDRISSSS